MIYTFADGGDGSLNVLIDGVFEAAINGSEVSIYKNIPQNYVELSDSEHVFFAINTTEVSGATTLDDIVTAIEAALPNDSDGGGGGAVAPTSITVAAAQALVTGGLVVVGQYYSITDSTQVQNVLDRIVVRGATASSFEEWGMYIDNVNGITNDIIYTLDDTPTDYIIFRRDNLGNEIWDIGNYGTLLTFPFNTAGINTNLVKAGIAALTWGANTLTGNDCIGEPNITDGGFTGVAVSYNKIGFGSGIIMGADGAQVLNCKIGNTSSVTSTGLFKDCNIGDDCNIDDGGFNIRGCTFLRGTTYTAIANIDNAIIGPLGIIDTTKVIDTTAGDSATIDSMTGRFRKDTSGTTFILTNSYIVADSIIQLTSANAAIDATATHWTVSAGVGSATITFNAAPTANFDMNFTVTN